MTSTSLIVEKPEPVILREPFSATECQWSYCGNLVPCWRAGYTFLALQNFHARSRCWCFLSCASDQIGPLNWITWDLPIRLQTKIICQDFPYSKSTMVRLVAIEERPLSHCRANHRCRWEARSGKGCCIWSARDLYRVWNRNPLVSNHTDSGNRGKLIRMLG